MKEWSYKTKMVVVWLAMAILIVALVYSQVSAHTPEAPSRFKQESHQTIGSTDIYIVVEKADQHFC